MPIDTDQPYPLVFVHPTHERLLLAKKKKPNLGKPGDGKPRVQILLQLKANSYFTLKLLSDLLNYWL